MPEMVTRMSPPGFTLYAYALSRQRTWGIEGFGMTHKVVAVADELLPAGQHWVYGTVGCDTTLFVGRSEFADPDGLCELLGRAWVAWRAVGHPVPTGPALPLAG